MFVWRLPGEMVATMQVKISFKLFFMEHSYFLSFRSHILIFFHTLTHSHIKMSNLRLDWLRVRTRMPAERTSPVLMALIMRNSGNHHHRGLLHHNHHHHHHHLHHQRQCQLVRSPPPEFLDPNANRGNDNDAYRLLLVMVMLFLMMMSKPLVLMVTMKTVF